MLHLLLLGQFVAANKTSATKTQNEPVFMGEILALQARFNAKPALMAQLKMCIKNICFRNPRPASYPAFLAFSEAEWNRWPAGPYLIECQGNRKLLGGTGLAFETPTVAATGYVIARNAWGHG
jgi:RimJ/RimL family protein N-acetyltransferase